MKGLEINLVVPDLWQQEAVRALQSGRDVVVHAPTGAGKTYIFELLYPSLKGQAVFTVPTRALANDKLAEWRARGWDVGIATGDLAFNLDARVIVATLETQRARFLRRKGPRLLVVDEYQLIADPVRGVHYELAIALAPHKTQLLLLSGSVQNPHDVVDWLRRNRRDAFCSSGTINGRCRNTKSICARFPISVSRGAANFWPRMIARALHGGPGAGSGFRAATQSGRRNGAGNRQRGDGPRSAYRSRRSRKRSRANGWRNSCAAGWLTITAA